MSARPARPNSILALAAALALLGSAGAIAQPPRPTRILLLYQQQAEAPQMVEFTRRLRATIQNGLSSPVEFYQESLDLDRFSTVESVSRLSRYFEDKYRGFAIDAVVPIGGRALEFVSDHLSGVLAGAPVVFALAAVPQTNPSGLPPNVTGRIAIASRFEPTLSMALALQPDAGRWSSSAARARPIPSRSPRSTRRSPTSATRSTCPSFRGWRSTRCSEGFARFPSVASSFSRISGGTGSGRYSIPSTSSEACRGRPPRRCTRSCAATSARASSAAS